MSLKEDYMIYWISGPYGVGKSTVAKCLQEMLPKAFVYDAEEMGNAVRENYPDECRQGIVFDGYPLWREFNYRLLKDIATRYEGDILVDMTIVCEEAYPEIIERLRADGVEVKYVILDADWKTIHDRVLKRGEKENCWCMQNIEMCLEYQQKETHAIHVNALNRSPEEIAKEIAEKVV